MSEEKENEKKRKRREERGERKREVDRERETAVRTTYGDGASEMLTVAHGRVLCVSRAVVESATAEGSRSSFRSVCSFIHCSAVFFFFLSFTIRTHTQPHTTTHTPTHTHTATHSYTLSDTRASRAAPFSLNPLPLFHSTPTGTRCGSCAPRGWAA